MTSQTRALFAETAYKRLAIHKITTYLCLDQEKEMNLSLQARLTFDCKHLVGGAETHCLPLHFHLSCSKSFLDVEAIFL